MASHDRAAVASPDTPITADFLVTFMTELLSPIAIRLDTIQEELGSLKTKVEILDSRATAPPPTRPPVAADEPPGAVEPQIREPGPGALAQKKRPFYEAPSNLAST